MNRNNSMFAFKPFETRESFGMIEFMKYKMVLESTSNYFNASYLYKHHRSEDSKCEPRVSYWMKTNSFKTLIEKYTKFLINTNQSDTIYNNSLLFTINSTKDINDITQVGEYIPQPAKNIIPSSSKIPKNDEYLRGTYIHPLLLMVLVKRLNPDNAIKMNSISLHYMKESSINDALANGLIDESNYQYYKDSLNTSKVKTHAIVNDQSVEESKTYHEGVDNKVTELQKKLDDAILTIVAKDAKIKRRDARIAVRDDKIDTLITNLDKQSNDIKEQKNMIKNLISLNEDQSTDIKQLKRTNGIMIDKLDRLRDDIKDMSDFVKKNCSNDTLYAAEKECLFIYDLRSQYAYADNMSHFRLCAGRMDYINDLITSLEKESETHGEKFSDYEQYRFTNIENAGSCIKSLRKAYKSDIVFKTLTCSMTTRIQIIRELTAIDDYHGKKNDILSNLQK